MELRVLKMLLPECKFLREITTGFEEMEEISQKESKFRLFWWVFMTKGPKEDIPTPDNETFKLKFQFYNEQVVNDFLNHKFFFYPLDHLYNFPLLPQPLPLVITNIFSVCMILVAFFFFKIPCVREITQYLSFSV